MSSLIAFDRLRAAIERSAVTAGLEVTVAAYTTEPWASATFNGGRHMLIFSGPSGSTFEKWCRSLEQSVPVLPGHLVADLMVREISNTAAGSNGTIEALTVEAA